MKLIKNEIAEKSEYTVEFECFSKFLVMFDDTSGITKTQVIQKAKDIAEQVFGNEGSLVIERNTRHHSYVLTGLAIDSRSAIVLSHAPDKAQLKLIK